MPEWLEKLLKENPNVKEWYEKMGQIPEIQETQTFVNAVAKMFAAEEKKE